MLAAIFGTHLAAASLPDLALQVTSQGILSGLVATFAYGTAIRALGIPVVTAWTHDIIASDDPLFCGRPGTIGTRAGNFTTQSADVLLVVGSRLNIRQISYNFAGFAPGAFKIQVDIDPAEMAKPFLHIDDGIVADAGRLCVRILYPAAGAIWGGGIRRGREGAFH